MSDMRQWAPFPDDLQDIVDNLKITNKPAYVSFELLDMERDHAGTHSGSAGGLTFIAHTEHKDAYHDRPRPVAHIIPVPAATFNREAWVRWVFDRLVEIETHEIGEGLTIDGEHPMAPTHGPGDNPYVVVQYATDEQRRTAFTGKVNQ